MEMEELENKLTTEGAADYRSIPIPENIEKKLGETIQKAKRAKKIRRFYIPAAAAIMTLVILPNTGASVAYAVSNIPVVGKLFQAVTFRNYQYEGERFNADVEVPQIIAEDIGIEGSKELEEALKQVNFDIEKTTEQLIADFEASAELGESYGELEIKHEIVTDNERYFSLRLFIYQGAGSGTQSYKIYTVDKLSGKQVQLKDLFLKDSDYNNQISENIREQMRARMKEDESKAYWVDKEDMPGLNWQGLKEDQNFYFDVNENIVIAFDEYEVAPGYMGVQEFTVEKEVYNGYLK